MEVARCLQLTFWHSEQNNGWRGISIWHRLYTCTTATVTGSRHSTCTDMAAAGVVLPDLDFQQSGFMQLHVTTWPQAIRFTALHV